MPIRPELRHFYLTEEWREKKARIRERSGNKCEWCKRPNGHVITAVRGGSGWWFDEHGSMWRDCLGRTARTLPPGHLRRRIRTVVQLGTAHLDHDPANLDDDNLADLCRRCHLLYDGPHHRATARLRRDAETGQLRLDLRAGAA